MSASPALSKYCGGELSLEVERRLDYTTEDLKDLVESIKEALQELRVKLDLGSDVEVKEGSVVGKRALLKIAAISVNISQHEDAVNQIADANRKLEMLLAGNLRNETLRKRTFEGKLSGLLKNVTWMDYEQVFVTAKPENSSAVYDDGWDGSASYDGNPSLHALGVLLMEVMLWKSIYDFWDDVKSKYSHTPAHVFLNIRSDNGFRAPQVSWSVLDSPAVRLTETPLSTASNAT
ncbi:uncharacterized protein G6M90_00g045560 [Metarhizium brunneum]|uniref:Uncharacterized protein n=1 Tax=Metarhizium brunneum TaxID=500148 RepID=A0A7D5YSX2_9HYPO|nr:hypothetical protein G6M90_00g045560 [Metarhizium brunneum]